MTCYTFDLGDGDTARASFDHEPSPEDLAAVRDVALAAKRQEKERRSALSPEERAAEDERRAEGMARREALLAKVRGIAPPSPAGEPATKEGEGDE